MSDITTITLVISEAVNLKNNNDIIDHETRKSVLSLTEQHIMYKIGECALKIFIST